MKRIRGYAFMLIFLVALCGCKITGTITDPATGEPVEGVSVKVTSYYGPLTAQDPIHFEPIYSTKTDSNGKYTISSWFSKKEGYVLVEYSKEGYDLFPPRKNVPANGEQIQNSFAVKLENPEVYNGDITISGDEDLHLISEYSTVTKSLTLSGLNVADLSALSNLKAVMGRLIISENPGLINLDGLNGLRTIGSEILVKSNPALEALTDFSNLRFGSMIVEDNGSLKHLSGLDLSKAQNCNVEICFNPMLENLTGLSVPEHPGRLWIMDNDGLKDLAGIVVPSEFSGSMLISSQSGMTLHGIENLTSVGGISIRGQISDIGAMQNLENANRIGISDNPVIEDLSVFSNIKSLDRLMIFNADRLVNLDVFENIETLEDFYVGGCAGIETLHVFKNIEHLRRLTVEKNDRLFELGLDNLKDVKDDWPSSTYLKITDNPQLCTSLAEELVAHLDDPDRKNFYITIEGNKDCSQ
ncbi:MAG: carboxypeptidase regulatory-like domain-containing protein [Proteobacteria bacterium]|nr:carboxypeptidase regulatory-like domain-containing protein [Pseudomonadota bacterium]